MEGRASRGARAVLELWAESVPGAAPWILLGGLLATGVSVWYAAGNLGVDTDTADMLSEDLPFRRLNTRYREAFPGNRPGLLLVVDAGSPEEAAQATQELQDRLRDEPLVESAYDPTRDPFFQDHALLYIEPARLDSALLRLDRAPGDGPSLTTVLRRRDLPGLLRWTEGALAEGPGPGYPLARPVLVELTRGMGAALQERDYRLSWERALTGAGPDSAARRQVLTVEPVPDYGALLPIGDAMERIRQVTWSVEQDHAPDVSVRITGPEALEHEELLSVTRGASIAGAFSLGLVVLTLLGGLRSPSLVVATSATLLAGLAVTGAFAAWAVGRLNMISVAFAVLYIGLGVDYAIHLSLRYRELLGEGLSRAGAVTESIVQVGPSLALCAATTAAAFYAFVPTSFRGVAELGLISGTSMFVGLVASLTLLPAFLSVMAPPEASPRPGAGSGLVRLPFRRGRLVRRASLALGVLSLALLPAARFDYNPNHLRDPGTESVSTFQDLLSGRAASPWSLTHLASGRDELRETVPRLEALATVERVVTVDDFVPTEQRARLGRLSRMRSLLATGGAGTGTASDGDRGPEPDRGATLAVVSAALPLLDRLSLVAGPASANRGDSALVRLRAATRGLVTALSLLDRGDAEDLLDRLEDAFFGELPALRERLDTLQAGGPLDPEDLPDEIRSRWIGLDGSFRAEIVPVEDLGDEEALRRFVADVTGVTPRVTGLPVIYLEAGRAVVGAFRQAFLSALVVIGLFLLLVLRSLRDTAYVLLPLALAGTATGGLAVALGIPFNFANVIVLPLLFGLGVDNGIHLVHRSRRLAPGGANVLATSTSRAIVVSGLTTLLSFSSLAFTAHRGIATMGQLLVLGVALILLATLVVLPAFLAREVEGRVPAA